MAESSVDLVKVTVPDAAGTVPRERLFQLLDQGRRRSIIWVSGPAGSGKTTLVAGYLAFRNAPCIWYQMDRGDADAATFFYYLGLAAKKAAPCYEQPLPLLTPEYLGSAPVFSRRYFEDLCTALASLRSSAADPPSNARTTSCNPDAGIVIAFDNYHEVPVESSMHEVFAAGLAALPSGCTAIVMSRGGPPATFARFRANGRLATFVWDDLRFTFDESRELVRTRGLANAAAHVLDRMHANAQGWAAGLVLMAESVKKIDDLSRLTDVAETPKEIFHYFAGEILDRLDSDTSDFLLLTSFLPVMTARSAAQLTDQDDAADILARLTDENFFTDRFMAAEPRYQYHPLFREFLQKRIKSALSGEGVLRLQKKAAKLLAGEGRIEEAVPLLREAEDWDSLAELIMANAQALASQGRSKTLLLWLQNMPDGMLSVRPWLSYWRGISQMPYDLALSRAELERSYAAFSEANNVEGLLLSWCGIVDTYVYEWSDFTPLDRWIAEIEAILRSHPTPPSPEIEARVASAVFCALMYRQPGHPDLPMWEERVKTIILAGDDIRMKMIMSSHLILYNSWWTGEQAKAAFLISTLRSSVQSAQGGRDPLAIIVWRALEAAYLWIVAEKDACLDAVQEGLGVAEQSGVHIWDFMLYSQAGLATLSSGELASAAEYRKRAEFILSTNRRLDICHYLYQMAWAALCENNLALALEHAETGYRISQETGAPFIRAYLSLAMADVLIELERYDDAEVYLQEAHQIGGTTNIKTAEYLCLWLEANRCLKRGNVEAALPYLRRHFFISRTCGILNNGFWRASVMKRLYAVALDAGIEAEHVYFLIRKRGLTSEAPSAAGDAWPWPLRIYTLGRFEVEVEGAPLRFGKKAPRKPLELLKTLISLRGKEARPGQIADMLWPDAEGDLARESFEVTHKRLRRLLGEGARFQNAEGRLALDPRTCWVDAWAFEQLIEETEREVANDSGTGQKSGAKKAKSSLSGRSQKVVSLLEKAVTLYRGSYLPADNDFSWSISARERLRYKFINAVERLGMAREQGGDLTGALACYHKALEVDDLAENFYQRLIACYHRAGRRGDALAAYDRCRKILAKVDLEPSDETKALYLRSRGR